MVYEQCLIGIWESDTAAAEEKYPQALEAVVRVTDCIYSFRANHELPEPLLETLAQAEDKRQKLSFTVNSQLSQE